MTTTKAPADLNITPEQEARVEVISNAFLSAIDDYRALFQTVAQLEKPKFEVPFTVSRNFEIEEEVVQFYALEGRFSREFINYLFNHEAFYEVIGGHFIPERSYYKKHVKSISSITVPFTQSRVWAVTLLTT